MGESFKLLAREVKKLVIFIEMVGRVGIEPTTN